MAGASVRLVTQGGSTTETYTHRNHQGSPVGATTANGFFLWRQLYSPYGEKADTTGGGGPTGVPEAESNNEGFTGHISDAHTDLT